MDPHVDRKPIASIVVDTGPLINNTISIASIRGSAETIYTTPAILSEIRDAVTRARVETTLIPFLNIRSPSPASVEAVASFSKKTGDYAVLSRQDLSILALAYELHCEKNGGPKGLRTEPRKTPPRKPTIKKSGEAAGKNDHIASQEQSNELIEDPSASMTTPEVPFGVVDDCPNDSARDEGADDPVEDKVSLIEVPQLEAHLNKAFPALAGSADRPTTSALHLVEDGLSRLTTSAEGRNPRDEVNPAEDDSDEDWITPDNIAKHQAAESAQSALPTQDQRQLLVTTMTTDFAMQNVLLQMNLSLLSANMQRIRNVRSSILRCHACFLTTKEMSKQFCPRCGQPTLQRVSCSTNSKGDFRIHLKHNYQYDKRGDRFSVPKPVGGTANTKYRGQGGGKGGWGTSLVFAEDQKEYSRQIEQGRRTKTRDLMDDDYLPGILTGHRNTAGGRPKVGGGRNVNSKKRF